MKKFLFIFFALAAVFFLGQPVFAGAPSGDFTLNSMSAESVTPGTGRVLILDLTLPQNTTSNDSVVKAGVANYKAAAGSTLTTFTSSIYAFASSSADDDSDFDNAEAIIWSSDGVLDSSTTDIIMTAGGADFTTSTGRSLSGKAATSTATAVGTDGWKIMMTGSSVTDEVWVEGDTIWIDYNDNGWTTATDMVLVAGTNIHNRNMNAATMVWVSTTAANIGFLDSNHDGFFNFTASTSDATTSEPIVRTGSAGRPVGYAIGTSAEDEFLTALATTTEWAGYIQARQWNPDWVQLSGISYAQSGDLRFFDGSANGVYTGTWVTSTQEASSAEEDIVKDSDNSGLYQTARLTALRVLNAGSAGNNDITKLEIFEDGANPGWNGDEVALGSATQWDSNITFTGTVFSSASSTRRVFATVDIASGAVSGNSLIARLSANYATLNSNNDGPSSGSLTATARQIIAPAVATISAPVSPIMVRGEAISSSAIRWYFTDKSNNETGFRIYDSSIVIVGTAGANAAYIEETGLTANTEYSGRKVVAYNTGGESPYSAVFPTVKTLAATPAVSATPAVPAVPATPAEPETKTPAVPATPATPAVPAAPAEKPITQMTKEELTVKVAEILAQIKQLQASLAELQAVEQAVIGVPTEFSFTKTLQAGNRNTDVKYLQLILISQGLLETGSDTGYFGSLTKAAVIKFQEKYAGNILTPNGLTKGTGRVASATRAKLNALLGK